MNKSFQNKPAAAEQTLLPEDKSHALKVMIKFSERLIALSEQETQALIQDDMTRFAILQDEKNMMSIRYAKASNEFRARLEDFRVADPGLLDRLEKLQSELGEKITSNNEIVSQIFLRTKKTTQESLITVQELGQKKPVFMNGQPSDQVTGV